VYQTETRDGMNIDFDVPIPMDDGISLRADVFRPIADGAYPVVMTMGPYAKGLHFEDGYTDPWHMMCEDHPDVPANSTTTYAGWETVDPEKWVREGYVVVRVDSRGAGRSPGRMAVFSPRETQDYYDCIEWAAVQPWSSGKVGLCGISYFATNQWFVASMHPPHLAAIVPWEGMNDAYRELSYHGGIYCSFTAVWYPRQVMSIQHGRGSRAPKSRVNGLPVAGDKDLTDEELLENQEHFPDEIASRPLIDEWYEARQADLEKVTVPVLSAANLGGDGLHLRGNLEGFMRVSSQQKWLEFHGAEHWTHFYTDYGRELQLEFLDHFLKGADNGWDRRPPVLLNVRQVDDTFVPRTEEAWPIPRTVWTPMYLDASTMSLSATPPQAEASVTYETLGEGATFTTTFDEDVEITGPMSARLRISSQTEDADVFVTLRLFDPQGEEVTFTGAVQLYMPISHGWLRASHRKVDPERSEPWRPWHPHKEQEMLVPGERYDLDIEIWATSLEIPAGYTLALTVSGHDYEPPVPVNPDDNEMRQRMHGVGPFRHDGPDRRTDTFDTEVTLYTGGDADAQILLPLVPPKGDADQ
jgi:uncharacterized protein